MTVEVLPSDYERALRTVAVYAHALNVNYWVAWIDGAFFAVRTDTNTPFVLRGAALVPVESERDVLSVARWYVAPGLTILDVG